MFNIRIRLFPFIHPSDQIHHFHTRPVSERYLFLLQADSGDEARCHSLKHVMGISLFIHLFHVFNFLGAQFSNVCLVQMSVQCDNPWFTSELLEWRDQPAVDKIWETEDRL